jgi:hypothetical protein
MFLITFCHISIVKYSVNGSSGLEQPSTDVRSSLKLVEGLDMCFVVSGGETQGNDMLIKDDI